MVDPASAAVPASNSDAARLAAAENVFVELPAGAGKTELIAGAVAVAGSTGRQLVLTHTHAGVHALQARFNRLGVSPTSYTLATIAGWALKWSASYPQISALANVEPTTHEEWHSVYAGLLNVLANENLAQTIAHSFAGAFVDEYQDCTVVQHEAICELGTLVPVRVLGDPLQGIFGFTGESIRWSDHVVGAFSELGVDAHPWRWAEHNAELGDWVESIRAALIAGDPIDLRAAPITWVNGSGRPQQILTLKAAAKDEETSVVALLKWSGQCRGIAQMLDGQYGAMDELEGRDLIESGAALDAAATGMEAVAVLIDAVRSCFTRLPAAVKRLQTGLEHGKLPQVTAKTSLPGLVNQVRAAAEAPSPANLLSAAKEFETVPGVFVHRPDFWQSFVNSLATWDAEELPSCREATLVVRQRAREHGRRARHRTVSRPVLVKGLEYDHSVILDAGLFSAQEFYVAATRGRSTATVISDQPILQLAAPDL